MQSPVFPHSYSDPEGAWLAQLHDTHMVGGKRHVGPIKLSQILQRAKVADYADIRQRLAQSNKKGDRRALEAYDFLAMGYNLPEVSLLVGICKRQVQRYEAMCMAAGLPGVKARADMDERIAREDAARQERRRQDQAKHGIEDLIP
jgi:hypothetical protein